MVAGGREEWAAHLVTAPVQLDTRPDQAASVAPALLVLRLVLGIGGRVVVGAEFAWLG